MFVCEFWLVITGEASLCSDPMSQLVRPSVRGWLGGALFAGSEGQLGWNMSFYKLRAPEIMIRQKIMYILMFRDIEVAKSM